jgi:hypothetical protein
MSDKYHYVRCRVTGNALAVSKNKGTPSVKISLATVPHEGEVSYPLWCDLWLTDATQERTIETLEKVLGWQGQSFAELNEPCFDGVEVVAVCEWEEDDQGRPREKVAFLNSTAGGGVKKAEAGDVRAITSKMDGFLKLARAGKPKPPAVAKAAPKYDDDLPFGG